MTKCKGHFRKNCSIENEKNKKYLMQKNVNTGVEPQFNLCPEFEPQGI